MPLFKLRYKKSLGPVQSDLIEAKDIEQAHEVGKAFCDNSQIRFVGVVSAVVADASILPKADAVPPAKVAKTA